MDNVRSREAPRNSLQEAIRKMTSLNASKLDIRDRGLIRAGHYADLVIFDPATIIDKATYTEPFQYPEGIQFVVVNGEVVLERGTHSGKKPGKALRRATLTR